MDDQTQTQTQRTHTHCWVIKTLRASDHSYVVSESAHGFSSKISADAFCKKLNANKKLCTDNNIVHVVVCRPSSKANLLISETLDRGQREQCTN